MRKSDRELDAALEQDAADFLHSAHDTAGLWRKCTDKACLRTRTCRGEADACGVTCFPEGWAWVQALLQALRGGRPPRDAMRVADRQVVAGEQVGAFGQRPRKIIVHYPGLGESFELMVDPSVERRRRRPNPLPRPLAPTHGVGHSRGRANKAIPRRS